MVKESIINYDFNLNFPPQEILNPNKINMYKKMIYEKKLIEQFIKKKNNWCYITDVCNVSISNMGYVLHNGFIKVNIKCTCKIKSPKIGDTITFNILNIIIDKIINVLYYQDTYITLGIINKHNKNIGDSACGKITDIYYKDNKLYMMGNEVS